MNINSTMACDPSVMLALMGQNMELDSNETLTSNITNSSPNDDQTQQLPLQVTFENTQFYVNKVVLPVIFSMGIFGNIMNLVIFSRRRIRHRMSEVEKASTTGLISLAISDMLFCLIGLLSHFLDPFTEGTWKGVGKLSTVAFYYSACEQALLNTFSFTSTWIITVMSLERWTAAKFPFVARRIASMRKTVYINIFIYIFSVIFNIPDFLEASVVKFDCPGDCKCYYKVPGLLYKYEKVAHAYRILWAIVGIVLPIIILLFCNVMFLLEIHQSRMFFSNENKSMLGHTPNNTNSNKAVTRITIILIGIILSFFILVAPSMIMSLVKSKIDPGSMSQESFLKFGIAVVICNMTQAFNFAINFLLYCSMSREFRGTLTKMLCRPFARDQSSFYNSPTQQASRLVDITSRSTRIHRDSSTGKSLTLKMNIQEQ